MLLLGHGVETVAANPRRIRRQHRGIRQDVAARRLGGDSGTVALGPQTQLNGDLHVHMAGPKGSGGHDQQVPLRGPLDVQVAVEPTELIESVVRKQAERPDAHGEAVCDIRRLATRLRRADICQYGFMGH